MKHLKTYIIKTFENISLDIDLYRYSSKISSLQQMRELIKRGANVNYRQVAGWTPLIEYAVASFFSGVKLLIENGAEINLTNNDGFSALMIAIASNNFNKNNVKKIVDILIENDADLNIQNKKGRDIFDINKNWYEYISNKFPEKYQEYLIKKDAKKYNI